MSTFETLQDIMASALELPKDSITQKATMDQIEEWDSLGHVHIMVALEGAFDLYMDVDDFAELDSVAAILKYLEAEGEG